jgi:ribose 1,5-bisphosphokinase
MLVLVVGPSGAGKDTLLNAARAALANDANFVFPRRVVTRQAVAALEDHDSVSEAEFAAAQAAGAYALSWSAHGLRYGLPARLVDDLKAGRTVVFNSSRAMVAEAQAKFPGTRVVLVEATPEVRAKRLGGRGRETEAEIAARLAREVPAALPGAIRVDNSGSLESGIAAFLAALRQIAED